MEITIHSHLVKKLREENLYVHLGQASSHFNVGIYVGVESGSLIRREGLTLLAEVPQLVYLNLGCANFSDQDLAPLQELRSLQSVHLQGSRVSDLGVSFLAHLPHLKELNLFCTQVTDAAMDSITSMPSLEDLYIGGNPGISIQGLAMLTQCAKLRYLDLESSVLNDDVLRSVSQNVNLEGLNIDSFENKQVTESGLLSLLSLQKLQLLGSRKPGQVAEGNYDQIKKMPSITHFVPGGCAWLFRPRDRRWSFWSVREID